MKEYDLYIPLNYNDGSAVESEKLAHLKNQLFEQFGGFTNFPQRNEGFWKLGEVTFRDEIVILRILASDADKAQRFFAQLKHELQREFQQEEILMVEKEAKVL